MSLPLRFRLLACALIALGLLFSSAAHAQNKAVRAEHGMVVSVSEPGSQAGVEMLRRGGNAVDAAVATALALAVTHPPAGNIGGGGFMLVYGGPVQEAVCIDYRETAPGVASAEMYQRDDRDTGHRVVGVPGTVRGLALAHSKYGKLPWNELVAPAIRLAEEGFGVDPALASSLSSLLKKSPEFAELQRVFKKADGSDLKPGEKLVQPDLAKAMRLLADGGPDAFYRGPIADLLVAEMKAGGGLITHQDLAGYEAKARKPVQGKYRGHDLFASSPPSSGGTCLMEMLGILEPFELRRHGRYSPETVHLVIEAMKRAYCDRARYLGDPDFTPIPADLTSQAHVRQLAADIDPKRATPSESLAKDIPLAREGESTTHFSVIDSSGLAVANTYTLQNSYGSRVVVRGAGFLLNNEMTDFNWRPGHTDRTGKIGTKPNLIEPHKRMLSSQTPCIVAREGRVELVTGSPGGRTIINTVLSVVLGVLEFEEDVQTAVNAPRWHHQWLPDEAKFEGAKRDEFDSLLENLRSRGHKIAEAGGRQGDAHSILVKDGAFWGAADKRLNGSAVGY